MTKGGSSKPKMLGRLIFGEKRKQHASPSRHRSVPRNGDSMVDTMPSGGGGVVNKNPIDLHDWAAWRMKLNEQMGNGTTERSDIKQMRQFLHGNSFYQQHSRDPSNGRYKGVQLLFSIPHAKLKSESAARSQRTNNKNMNTEVKASDQNNVQSSIHDHAITSTHAVSAGSPIIIDKTISQLLPKGLIKNTDDFLHVNEQMIAADTMQTHRSFRTLNKASDRVHSTLQKAVKDGNVLEKIKAFEMQAAAAQAVSAVKSVGSINTRLQSSTSSIQSTTHRTLSPPTMHRIQQPISPMKMQHDPHQQYVRSHRSRHVHPVQYHRRDGNVAPMINRESRKEAHVLEPVHGDIILKRRTPSQKTVNDEDYTMTAMSSMAATTSQGPSYHSRQHHRGAASTSRSRHHQEIVYDKRTSKHHESGQKKHQQKQKELAPSSSAVKTSTRRRWLRGRKETSPATVPEKSKEEISEGKFKKNSKNKKKNKEQEKLDSIKITPSPTPQGKTSSSSDNSRVYGVPTAVVNGQNKSETTSPQLPSRIEEENESDREEKYTENQSKHILSKEENTTQSKECDTIVAVERRPSKTKHHQKLSSTDGEILSRVDDETRFSRPTDDHAHRSELNDEDDAYKSEGDVFIEESSVTDINSHPQQSSTVIHRQLSQCSDDPSSDRRWQWSKESGGLITKGNRKKSQPPITLITRKNTINQEDVQTLYETSQSEQLHISKKTKSPQPISTSRNNSKKENATKPILHTIINSTNNTNNQRQPTTDEFFEIGPHTNPEEAIHQMTSSS